MTDKQTIFALSTGRPPSAISIVRVSGPRASAALEIVAGRIPPAREARFTRLRSKAGESIDEAIVLWFPGPESATGEDVAEFHVHGGRAVVAALVKEFAAIAGMRPAEPGEFTRRAFENGKLDLAAAEGLHDLVFAETEMQRRQALRHLGGLLGDKATEWRRQLIEAAALVEAGIDFSDEGDVPDELIKPALATIATLKDEIEKTLVKSAHSERLRDGLVVAIAGPVNAGKSTLLNRLARRDVAIVSPHAGTTRDVIEVHLDLEGYPVTLLDTAGIRTTDDPVELEGIRRARARTNDADIVLWVNDATDPMPAPPDAALAVPRGTPAWQVTTKMDLLSPGSERDIGADGERTFAISGTEDQGLDLLVAALTRYAAEYFGGTESAVIARARHRQLLEDAAAALARALGSVDEGEELVAENIRIAIHNMGKVVGKVDIEDVLDMIFAEFCIGK